MVDFILLFYCSSIVLLFKYLLVYSYNQENLITKNVILTTEQRVKCNDYEIDIT